MKQIFYVHGRLFDLRSNNVEFCLHGSEVDLRKIGKELHTVDNNGKEHGRLLSSP